MAAKKIKVVRYECICDLPECCGKGKPWTTRTSKLPNRCRWCKQWSWNGDRRKRDFSQEDRAKNSANADKRWKKAKLAS